MAKSWQEEQAETRRKQRQHQDRVSGLVEAVHDLLEGQPLDTAIEALEKALQGLRRLKNEAGRR